MYGDKVVPVRSKGGCVRVKRRSQSSQRARYSDQVFSPGIGFLDIDHDRYT